MILFNLIVNNCLLYFDWYTTRYEIYTEIKVKNRKSKDYIEYGNKNR